MGSPEEPQNARRTQRIQLAGEPLQYPRREQLELRIGVPLLERERLLLLRQRQREHLLLVPIRRIHLHQSERQRETVLSGGEARELVKVSRNREPSKLRLGAAARACRLMAA